MFTVWTIGHSNHPLEKFIAILQSHRIEVVADVRRFPGSRLHPQFNQSSFARSLNSIGIDYASFPDLGGRRTPHPNSKNTAWRNPSFRGYADYMETHEFRNAIHRLVKIAEAKRTAVLCAEAVWWQCHRSLIADDLKSQNIQVLHILNEKKIEPHSYTKPARIVNGRLTYQEDSQCQFWTETSFK